MPTSQCGLPWTFLVPISNILFFLQKKTTSQPFQCRLGPKLREDDRASGFGVPGRERGRVNFQVHEAAVTRQQARVNVQATLNLPSQCLQISAESILM